MWLMGCAVFYQGGVAVAMALAAIYAEQVIGFKQQETMVLIFVLNLAAAGGAFAWGYLQDRIGHKLALGSTLVGWIAVCVIAALSRPRASSGGPRPSPACAWGPASRPAARWPACSRRRASRRVLRPVDLRHPAGQHHRPAPMARSPGPPAATSGWRSCRRRCCS
jgi:hypothetical protein